MRIIKPIYEYFESVMVLPAQLDHLLAHGWRHFGTLFYRYSYMEYEDEITQVLPLRLPLENVCFTKSQRRNLRKNSSLKVEYRDSFIDAEKISLFENHKKRFRESPPESLYDFFSDMPSCIPCNTKEIAVFDNGKLIAVSFLDVAIKSTSTIYAMFDLEYSKRGLGIFTALKEIEISKSLGKEFYYLGYSYEKSSFYDYKKKFRNLEQFDWDGNWMPFDQH